MNEPIATTTPGATTILAALVLAAAAALATTGALDAHQRLVGGLEAGAVVVLAIGIGLASTRTAAAAVPIAMAGAVVGSWEASTITWGWAIVVGSGWYLALELALVAIERRGSRRHTAAVAARRQWEVAVVIAVAATFGLVSFALATIAPARDLSARVVGVIVVLGSMMMAHRRLTG